MPSKNITEQHTSTLSPFLIHTQTSLESHDGSNTGSNSTEADGVTASSTRKGGRSRAEAGGPGGRRRRARSLGHGVGAGWNDRDRGRVASGRVDISGLLLGAGGGGDGGDFSDGAGGSRLGRGVSGGGGRRLLVAVVGVLDAELGGPLVGTLAGAGLDDEQEAVVGGVGLELGRGRPLVGAAVGDVLSKGVHGLDVGAGATEEHERDGALGGRIPGDGVGLADRDQFLEARLGDGIAAGRNRVVGGGVGSRHGHEGGDEAGGEETHCDG